MLSCCLCSTSLRLRVKQGYILLTRLVGCARLGLRRHEVWFVFRTLQEPRRVCRTDAESMSHSRAGDNLSHLHILRALLFCLNLVHSRFLYLGQCIVILNVHHPYAFMGF